jgi:CRISPR system Cascade subunit CasA
MPSFDLRNEPWIPVQAGTRTTIVSLQDLFLQAHELDDLAVPVPPAASGLWRVLYAITARVTGLDRGSGDWQVRQFQCIGGGAFDATAVERYFTRYADRFDLFHPQRPWMQEPRLAGECAKPSGINKLMFDRPAGNTQVWFGHFSDTNPVPVPTAEAAWHLIAQLYYGASGRCTARTLGAQRPADTTAGPLRGAMSYHPLGRTLFESLILGVPAPRDTDTTHDRCPWERDDLPDPGTGGYTPTGTGALLTGRYRHALLLVPAADGQTVVDAYLTWAWRTPIAPERDPYTIYKLSKEGNWYQHKADGARALWRDLEALLVDVDGKRQRPQILQTAVDLEIDDMRVRAFGFDQDGQAKDRQWFTDTTPPILAWLKDADEDALTGIGAVELAVESVGYRLAAVLRDAWHQYTNTSDRKEPGKPKDLPWQRSGMSYYWSHAEPVFWRHVNTRQYDSASTSFHALAHEAVDHAAGEQVRHQPAAKAIAAAHRHLSGHWERKAA